MLTVLLILGIVGSVLFGSWSDFSANKSWLRVTLIVLSGFCLMGFVLEPKWWSDTETKYALLTNGVDESMFDAKNYTEVFSLRTEDKSSNERTWLASRYFLKEKIPPESVIEIFGFGFDGNLSKIFDWKNQLVRPEKGIILEKAFSEIELGKEFELQFSLEGFADGDSLIVYKDGVRFDKISPGNEKKVAFKDKLTVLGPTTYEFEWESADTLIYESWNIRGVQPEVLNIGILGYSSSFETNYLVEHFGERGHKIIQRNRIGKDRFRYDAINTAISDAENILDKVQEMDVLILDAREFDELPSSDKNFLKTAIENGLDVLLNAPTVNAEDIWQDTFSELSDEDIEVETLNRLEERNWFPENDQQIREAIPLLNLSFSKQSDEVEVLASYAGNTPISLVAKVKNGSVTGALFYKTYGWILSGNEEIYNQFWSSYLTKVITLESNEIHVSPSVVRVNQRTNIFVTGDENESEYSISSVMEESESTLELTKGENHPEVKSATFWPEKEGWHKIVNENTHKWVYVYSPKNWEFTSQWSNYLNTSEFLSNQQKEKNSSLKSVPIPVPNWIWLLGFLIFQMILWVERKV